MWQCYQSKSNILLIVTCKNIVKISSKYVDNFLRYPADRCTDRVKHTKVKVRTLHTAPRSPQKRSGMACFQGSHTFTCKVPTRSFRSRNESYLPLPSQLYSWYSFTDPGGMEGWVGLGGWLRSETVYLPEGKSPIPLLTGLNSEQLRWSRPTRYRYTTPPPSTAW